jgi:hypothetical protein
MRKILKTSGKNVPSDFRNSENEIITFRRIRKAIGMLGMSLPILLVTLSLIPFFGTKIQASISNYYYTNLRELFTGILCAVGLFLIRYKGHANNNIWKNDSLLTNIAGCMAFGIALFPTNPDSCADKIYSLIPYCNNFLGWLHYGFAAAFFIILSIISVNVFTIGQKKNSDIPVSIVNENYIYKVCGYLIMAFVLMVPLFDIIHIFRYSTLLFEALALFSFGISWLIKGRALGDKGIIGERIYREHN